MLFFNKNEIQKSDREVIETKLKTSRSNLLFSVIITAVNIFLLLIGSDMYFLFSITTPYMLVSMAMFLCGKYPSEYYTDIPSDFVFMSNDVFCIILSAALFLLTIYFLIWLFSYKHRTWIFWDCAHWANSATS